MEAQTLIDALRYGTPHACDCPEYFQTCCYDCPFSSNNLSPAFNNLWKGREREPIVEECAYCECGMLLLASALTVVGSGVQAAETAKCFRDDCRDAVQQTLYAQPESNQVTEDRSRLQGFCVAEGEWVDETKALLDNTMTVLPRPMDLHTQSEEDRSRWALFGKPESQMGSAPNEPAGMSIILNLLSSFYDDTYSIF